MRNWLVGAWLVEFEQSGKDRAKYGQKLLESVAADLAKKEIKGISDPRVLRDCRVLYRVYPQIRGSLTRELETIPLPPNTPETLTVTSKRIRGAATRELPTPLALQELMRLSWTHLQELIRLDDPWQRVFLNCPARITTAAVQQKSLCVLNASFRIRKVLCKYQVELPIYIKQRS